MPEAQPPGVCTWTYITGTQPTDVHRMAGRRRCVVVDRGDGNDWRAGFACRGDVLDPRAATSSGGSDPRLKAGQRHEYDDDSTTSGDAGRRTVLREQVTVVAQKMDPVRRRRRAASAEGRSLQWSAAGLFASLYLSADDPVDVSASCCTSPGST